ncbi:PF20097 family protein [Nonomuraea jiangxiensis]|uniref:DUF6487 domain-containing protein n=1 Tax=Nonomuraea jiangxiensis TaxID=633440 RepID=A0A1G8JS73_9ACTN|nr:PF20097 family protein [Nonomuraea jiangxiensis]SDI34149.1 hypothetical protein SAMN05421869_105174 [Nonomuraea jiangxiensis]
MSDDALPCPLCSTSMKPGIVVGRSPGVKFKQSVGALGDLTGIRLTKGFGYQHADAFRCDECGTVVIPGT